MICLHCLVWLYCFWVHIDLNAFDSLWSHNKAWASFIDPRPRPNWRNPRLSKCLFLFELECFFLYWCLVFFSVILTAEWCLLSAGIELLCWLALFWLAGTESWLWGPLFYCTTTFRPKETPRPSPRFSSVRNENNVVARMDQAPSPLHSPIHFAAPCPRSELSVWWTQTTLLLFSTCSPHCGIMATLGLHNCLLVKKGKFAWLSNWAIASLKGFIRCCFGGNQWWDYYRLW